MSVETCWIVIRIYRYKRRVISIHGEFSEAEASYIKHARDLRDGDIKLVVASMETIRAQSGGYNRINW